MKKLSDAEFDRQLDEFIHIVTDLLKTTACQTYFTTAYLAYEDRFELQSLISKDDVPESYETLLDFGRHLRAQKVKAPPALFVGAHFEWMDGTPCIFLSGCAADGRKNGARLDFTRTGRSQRIRVTKVTPLYFADHHAFQGRTFATELMKGLKK